MKYDRCLSCSAKFNSENDVVKHLYETGHENYCEVRATVGSKLCFIGWCLMSLALFAGLYAMLFSFAYNSSFSDFVITLWIFAVSFFGLGMWIKYRTTKLQYILEPRKL